MKKGKAFDHVASLCMGTFWVEWKKMALCLFQCAGGWWGSLQRSVPYYPRTPSEAGRERRLPFHFHSLPHPQIPKHLPLSYLPQKVAAPGVGSTWAGRLPVISSQAPPAL